MADEKSMACAKQVYENMCKALDEKGWNFDKDEPKLVIYFGVKGDDFPMQFIIAVDAERQVIRLMSPLPFEMSASKRVEGALAVCAASLGMVDGSFDYDLSDGKIIFRMTASFRDSQIGDELFHYMIACSGAMVEKYNEKFFAIDKGLLSIEDFIADC